MLRKLGFVALTLLVLPTFVRAADEPEQLLSNQTQLYVRWDGMEKHKAAFDKTALGKILKGDAGKLLTGSSGQIKEGLQTLLKVQNVIGNMPANVRKQLEEDAGEVAKLLDTFAKHGFLFALEARSVQPPQIQATLIVPDAGGDAKSLFAGLRLATALAQAPTKEIKIGGHAVTYLQTGPITIAWWLHGKHAVLSLGTDGPEKVVSRMDAKDGTLADTKLFQRVRDFKKFDTTMRAFVDVAGLMKLTEGLPKEAAKIIGDLGLDGLKSLVMYSGFDGPCERSLTEFDVPGPRKGVLRLVGGKSFTLTDVPSLPSDTLSWSMTHFDLGQFHDVVLEAAEAVVGVVAPDQLPKIRGALQQADQMLGVKLRDDLLGSLGDKVLTYSSPSDGILFFGQTFLVKVKDAKKLNATLDQIVKSAAKMAPVPLELKKRTYHDVEIQELHVQQPGFFLVPTFAIHKDWLIVGFFPQQVQAFILRSKGELEAWKPDASTKDAFDKLPKEMISISVEDPRPGVQLLLSLAPMAGGAIRSVLPDSKFEVGSIPHAQEVTRHLFPNVTVVSDDGKVVRMETRASLSLPVDLGGVGAGVAGMAVLGGYWRMADLGGPGFAPVRAIKEAPAAPPPPEDKPVDKRRRP